MKSVTHVGALRPGADPFQEFELPNKRVRASVLGCSCDFVANDERLLNLVKQAFAGLSQQTDSKKAPRITITLRMGGTRKSSRKTPQEVPPNVILHSGAGLYCGVIDTDNYVVIAPQQRAALVVVSAAMLKHAYHVRYEMIEFAVYVLAAKVQSFLPLHAACVGKKKRGILVVGESGAGKSTLALHCLLRGFEFVAEDSVLIEPKNAVVRGVGSFLHLRVGTEYFLNGIPRWIRRSQVITRRSGIDKFEIDIRKTRYRIATRPLEIAAIVFLTSQRPKKETRSPLDLLAPLSRSELRRRLASTQVYAARQPGWLKLVDTLSKRKAFVLHRAGHPSIQVDALDELLG